MICTLQMSHRVEIVSNIQPKKIGLNVRRNGPQPSICVRTFSPITSECAGKLGEYSDKAETMELIAHPKRTLLRQEMKIRTASFLLKSALFFSNESDCGNRVRIFSQFTMRPRLAFHF